MVWVAPEIRNYVFYSDQENAKMWKVVSMHEVQLPRECVLFQNENVRHTSGGRKGKYWLRFPVSNSRIREAKG